MTPSSTGAEHDSSARSDADEGGMPAWRSSLGEAGPYLGLGLQIALSMAFFVGVGYAIDAWFGLLPWGTVTGAVLGMVIVFYYLIRIVGEMNRSSAARRQAEDRQERGEAGSAPEDT